MVMAVVTLYQQSHAPLRGSTLSKPSDFSHGMQSLDNIDPIHLSPMVTTTTRALLSGTISEMLNKTNRAIWKAQILAVLCGARLEGYLTDATKAPPQKTKDMEAMISNPEFEEWYAIDQHVLVYLLLSLPKEIIGQVAICTTTASAWGVIKGTYTSGTHAHNVNIRIALATMKRGNDLITEYVNKARTLADDMALAGKKIG
jgi:hypothetical protein